MTALHDIYHYRAVDDFVATSGQPSEAQLAAIANAGYATVINLALHDDPRYSLADEAATVQSLGMAYVHLPVPFATPTEADLLAFFAAMQEHRGVKTWVHCAANMRVSVFLGLYRVAHLGWTQHDAFDLVRGLWQPNPVWNTFIADMLARHAPPSAS